jgi:putative Ig domain-containing protein
MASGYPAPKYSLSGTLPTGLHFSNATGLFSGTAKTSDAAGDYPLTITATNSTGNASQNFTLTLQ